jgi:hypothetical protein
LSTALALITTREGIVVPALIAGAGKRAALRFFEYFMVNRQVRATLCESNASRVCLAHVAPPPVDGGTETSISCHTFRARGITATT